MGLIINALGLREQKVKELQTKVNKCIEETNKIPSLVIINASDDRASKLYIKNKLKLNNEIGIKEEVLEYEDIITTKD